MQDNPRFARIELDTATKLALVLKRFPTIERSKEWAYVFAFDRLEDWRIKVSAPTYWNKSTKYKLNVERLYSKVGKEYLLFD